MNWEIDECKSDSIDGFVENVINNNGVVGRYFDYWMNNDCFVGRTETLPESFIAFTKLLGYSCNEEAVRRNKNNYKSHGVEFPFEYEKAIKSSESVFINKYYPEWSC